MQRHVFYSLCRRAALAALFGFVASSALATGASPMEGTWGGADAQGRTAQITIVGDKVIGVFWEQDYHDAGNLEASVRSWHDWCGSTKATSLKPD